MHHGSAVGARSLCKARGVGNDADFGSSARERASGREIADDAALHFGQQQGDLARLEQRCDIECHCCFSPVNSDYSNNAK